MFWLVEPRSREELAEGRERQRVRSGYPSQVPMRQRMREIRESSRDRERCRRRRAKQGKLFDISTPAGRLLLTRVSSRREAGCVAVQTVEAGGWTKGAVGEESVVELVRNPAATVNKGVSRRNLLGGANVVRGGPVATTRGAVV